MFLLTLHQFKKTYWNYYLTIEEEFLETLKFVELNDINFNTFSYKYVSLLLVIGCEVTSVLKKYVQL